jgi:uncharacterized protein (UPF0332 family)
MDWTEIGRDCLRAAQRTRDEQVRSAISRAYYAAHSVLAHALIGAGYSPPGQRQTPPHDSQAKLIGRHFAANGPAFVRELRAKVRRLYAARLDADYNRRATMDASVSRAAIRDAHSVFLMLKVQP